MIDKELTLKLRRYGFFRCTSKGVFLYTEHDFRVFIPKVILLKVSEKLLQEDKLTIEEKS